MIKSLSVVLTFFFFVACSESNLEDNFDNSGDGLSPVLSGQVSVLNSDTLLGKLPLVSWPMAEGADVNFYQISLALDNGNGSCGPEDFSGSLALEWTQVSSAIDFSGAGYQLVDSALDGSGQMISLSWLGSTNYCIGVQAVGSNGGVSDAIFSDQVVSYKYLNCQERLTNEPMATDGIYEIDSDGTGLNPAYDVYCDMTTNGGGWTLLSNQNPIAGNLFTSKTDALIKNDNDPTNGIYSIMGRTAEFAKAGVFEFYLTWPVGGCSTTPHHWTQTSDPLVTNNAVTGYVSVSTPTNVGAGGFNGICSNSQTPLFKSNCGTSNWYYAVGSTSLFSGGAPGCSGAVSHVQFWVR